MRCRRRRILVRVRERVRVRVLRGCRGRRNGRRRARRGARPVLHRCAPAPLQHRRAARGTCTTRGGRARRGAPSQLSRCDARRARLRRRGASQRRASVTAASLVGGGGGAGGGGGGDGGGGDGGDGNDGCGCGCGCGDGRGGDGGAAGLQPGLVRALRRDGLRLDAHLPKRVLAQLRPAGPERRLLVEERVEQVVQLRRAACHRDERQQQLRRYRACTHRGRRGAAAKGWHARSELVQEGACDQVRDVMLGSCRHAEALYASSHSRQPRGGAKGLREEHRQQHKQQRAVQ